MDRAGIGPLLVALALAASAAAHAAPRPLPGRQADEPAAPPAASPEVPRVSRLQGTAYFDRNEDVVGATVVVRATSDAPTLYLTSTDERGRFRVEGLPDGQYTVRVERHGVAAMVKRGVEVRFPFRAVVELDMDKIERGPVLPTTAGPGEGEASGTVRVSGTTWTPGMLPMGEVAVRLVRPDGAHDPVMTRSAEDGSFALEEVPAGEWLATVLGVGMLPIRTALRLERDQRVEVRLVLQPASYSPSPLELMPPEEPIAPEGFGDRAGGGGRG